jgi:hypothetical protein
MYTTTSHNKFIIDVIPLFNGDFSRSKGIGVGATPFMMSISEILGILRLHSLIISQNKSRRRIYVARS